ncbi:MAG: Rrf2 family transcriptional regulator [Armatimonadetes bacterium]|nr:Rrf2 family transcriptional regulator [Armatimonadota bacterium]
MNFTAREDYGLRAVLELAQRGSGGPIQSKEIAARQGIPEQFLEQLLSTLRRGGLIRSVRGASGGYMLAKPASETTVGDVLRTLSGELVPIACLEPGGLDKCEHHSSYGVHAFWERLAKAITEVADGMTLQEMLEIQLSANAQAGYMIHI